LSRELARLIAGHVFLHACMAGMRMAAPLLALREGHSEAAVGVLLALFALTQVFLALPAGRYADRHGLKRPVAFSVMVAALGAAIAVALPVFPVLCLSALMTGGATGAASIALQRHVGRAARNPNPAQAGVFVVGHRAGGLQLPGALCRGSDDRPCGLSLCVPADGAAAAGHLVLGAAYAGTAASGPCRGRQAGPRLGPAREPMFRRLLLINWILSSCWDVHTFVVPVLGHERGLSASVIGSILGAFAIAAAAHPRGHCRSFAERVQRRASLHRPCWSRRCCLRLSASASPLAMGFCSVLLGLALGSVQPMVMSTLHQITPPARHGEALGLRLMAINASSVAMPMLFGLAGAIDRRVCRGVLVCGAVVGLRRALRPAFAQSW
jgi:MFS family permease